jgi:protein TonB
MKPSHLFHSLIVVALFGVSPLLALSVSEITDITPKVDEAPVPIRTMAPDYPAELKRSNVQGVVSVTVVIDESGSVIASEVLKSTNAAFNQPAINALHKWKFKPAKLGDKSVKVKVTIPVKFTIGED